MNTVYFLYQNRPADDTAHEWVMYRPPVATLNNAQDLAQGLATLHATPVHVVPYNVKERKTIADDEFIVQPGPA